MQKLFIAGTVGNVRGLRDAGSNKVFNFSVAVSNGKDANGNWRDSTFYDVGVWGNRGEALSKWLAKGTKVAVSGRHTAPRIHEGKVYLSMEADEVTALGGGEQGGQQYQERERPPPSGEIDDEIPF